MRHIKTSIAAMLIAGTVSQLSAAVFYQDYELPAFSPGDIVGQEGWSGNRYDNGDPDGTGLREVVTVANVPVVGATGTQFARFSTPTASAGNPVSVGGWTAITEPSSPLADPFTFTGQIGYSGLVHPANSTSYALLNLSRTGSNLYSGIFFGFSGNRTGSIDFVYRDGDDYQILFSDGLQADQFYSFEVAVRPGDAVWDLTVFDENGEIIESKEGIGVRGGVSSFDLVAARLQAVRNEDTALHFDNLQIIPEQGTTALIVGSSVALLVLLRLRSTHRKQK